MGRRDAIVRAGAAALVLGSQTVLPGAALAAKVPSGFTAVKDSQKGYAFAYPVGWQVSAAGTRGDMFCQAQHLCPLTALIAPSQPPQEFTSDVQDKVFKDVIEPLESVSLNIVPTQRKSLTDIGTPEEVRLPPPGPAPPRGSTGGRTPTRARSRNRSRPPHAAS